MGRKTASSICSSSSGHRHCGLQRSSSATRSRNSSDCSHGVGDKVWQQQLLQQQQQLLLQRLLQQRLFSGGCYWWISRRVTGVSRFVAFPSAVFRGLASQGGSREFR
ncbi:hypothetical protein Efla_003856 [Eimeria flavescens]